MLLSKSSVTFILLKPMKPIRCFLVWLLLWDELCPSKRYVKVLTPVTVNVKYMEIKSMQMASSWSHNDMECALIQFDWCLYKERGVRDSHTDTHRERTSFDDGGRDQSDASTSSGTQRVASNIRANPSLESKDFIGLPPPWFFYY